MYLLKRTILILLVGCSCQTIDAQSNPTWQQRLNYNINVVLHPQEKTLDGDLKVAYHNESPDTLKFIWFHLWPNAYKNDRTAFSEQLLLNDRTDFYFANENKHGYINQLQFKVNAVNAITVDHPQHQDIIQIILPQPLVPGDSCIITTPFHVKLPYNFSRGGYVGESFQITQWYPKPAVYDRYGWHPMPYLDQGEFYSEFADYQVTVTLPQDYKVAATGLQTHHLQIDTIQTITYKQERVHDFAWFADKSYIIETDTLQLSGRTIKVNAVHYPRVFYKDHSIMDDIKKAVSDRSRWLGEYPYDVVTVVESPFHGGSGMEYPTLAVIDQASDISTLRELIGHEVGHNWLYGILASNERDHMWLDEGINSYYDKRAASEGADHLTSSWLLKHPGLLKRLPDNVEDMITETICLLKKDQPINTSSEFFTDYNYDAIGYNKTSLWMQKLETILGRERFDSMMRTYYQEWRFRHPYPTDFFATAAPFLQEDSTRLFDMLHQTGYLKNSVKKEKRKISWMSFNGKKENINFYTFPSIGYNRYDGFMAGIMMHNYTLPLNKINFIITPMYGLRSKSINGSAYLSYTPYRDYHNRKLQIDFGFMSYHTDIFIDSNASSNFFTAQKFVPGVRWQWGHEDPRNKLLNILSWKTFLFRETNLDFYRDTMLQQNIIRYPVVSSYLNQLKFTLNNQRALYPYRLDAVAEQNESMIRLGITANEFFNYDEKGGMEVRFFAGKFFYLQPKTFSLEYATERFHLNMTGANGFEDYTYSNYFIGRNEFQGLGNRQLMIRDGGFKIRTDLLSSKIGKTDDWLVALNLSSTLPKKYNPLSMLPVQIPLKLFADFGTTPEYWSNENTAERVLFDAGIQLSLFKNIVNIYCPIVYSKTFSNYVNSTLGDKKFLKTISFSINVQRISLKTFSFLPKIPF